MGLGGAAVGTEQSQVLPFSLVFWDFAFASLIRPFDDFDSCSRVWPRMPVVPMLAFSVFIYERTAPNGNDTTYLKDEKVSIDEIKLTPLCGIQGIVSVILFLQLFFSVFPSPILASILHFETDLVRSFLLRFVL